MKSSSHERGLWRALLALAFFAALTASAAHARVRHSDAWAREHFAAAERMREALNGRPPADRMRHDYQRVVNAYRAVYMGAPASTKADPSVVAVAETLVEMGRRFDDDKILNGAIEQYKFLRREYPGSKYRFDGLFTIGEIYKDDLNDSEAARVTFQDFLRRYPHNRLASDARQAIVELNEEAEAEKAAEAQRAAEKKQSGKNGNKKDTISTSDDHAVREASGNHELPPGSGRRLPRVTGIRHWSTPDYTRVAIDVESEVKFSSQRIASPARIFFDLRDTKLASTLVGKSFDVDDGFLKKVRVAQYAPGRTRVVLEVDNLSDYDAFLLPNPYRLIIDIHGKNGRAKQIQDAAETAAAEADGVVPSKTPPGSDQQSSLETKTTVSTHAAPEQTALQKTGNADAEGEAAGDGAMASASKVSTVNKKPQTAVVKKIVDADDDEVAAQPAASAVKRNVRAAKREAVPARNTGDAKKPVDGDLGRYPGNDPDTSDAIVPDAGQSGPSDSRRKSSRALASGKSGRASDLGIREAKPTASGDRSLIRALGLKIGKIVIDPGHGGHDTGTIGPNGLEEKDLVLEVGRRLGKLLETRLGAEVVYTRKDDTFIPLETRTAIANQARADLFVSIHANSSDDPDARGVETYYLNFTSSPEALEVAARENAVSEKSIYELQDLVKKIALKEKIEESREFAGDVQQSLHSGLAVKSPAIRDRGVKKAPFIVLIGANMPSILAEISFVSNPTDEHRLATSEYRERIAESLYRGIAKYVNGLSGVKIASKMDKAAGQ
ncbi:MAG: N-acetylmuramoyl-L-alanine amidase [Candidatus Sulfotelmatobacter sp.]